jgi:cyclopropane-fatty-acyl-phospholipid synthase
MSASIEPLVTSTARHRRGAGPWGMLLARLIRRIEVGRLTVVLPSGVRLDHPAAKPGPEAVLVLARWRAMRRLLVDGDVGFAEAYVAGDWSSPDLTALIELAAANGSRLDRVVAGLWPVRLINRIRHLLAPNSRTGSRRNIAFHYDLGNAFYELWLDRSMTYSSALYAQPGITLEAAQAAKLARVVELLGLAGGERVLEIGCGWGALAARLAERGAEVTGLTLSTEQLAFAERRVAAAGLGGRVHLRLEDYRDVRGSYDRIVSIEMLEAVGEAYWPAYFRALRERLRAGGRAVLQVITIAEDRFETYRRGADFIQRHVFPGGMLPTRAIVAEEARIAGLRLATAETFGRSYALTLAEWRRRFLAAAPAIEEQGFSRPFRRLWEYYLCYSEAGFRSGVIDVGLYVLEG